MRYNNYHKHDHVSNIFSPDTNTKAEEYIKKCVEYGHTNYFTTNHGSMGDIFEAKELCEKYGIRCLAGLEGYIVPNPLEKDKSNYHIIVIPRTNRARRKLNKISSRANVDGYYYKPRIFPGDLLELDKNDVYITTACCAGLLRDEISFEKLFIPLYKHFKENILLEVQTHAVDIQKDINRKCLELRSKYGLRLIAANDSHYIDDYGKQERLELLKGKGITYGDEDEFILDFPTYETMVDRFKKQGILSDEQIEEAMESTLILDDCEEIDINKEIKMPTIYPELTPKERVKELKKIINKKFKKIKEEENIVGEEYERYKQGIRYEMEAIEKTNDVVHTADYFLFNTKMVDLAVNKYSGVLTRTGRGSCGSYYINRILGMTQIDRFQIKLPLYPDRFISTARLLENRAIPDIDYNVSSQEPFVKASKELLGENMCFPMIAYGTMKLGEAFRNVCRSHDLSFDEYNEVGKRIEEYLEDDKWKSYIEEANKYVGTIISASVHPCAHVLANEDLMEEYGVVRIGENICVMITSGEADAWKVLKNDYLIVTVWRLISETFKLAGLPIITVRELIKEIENDQRVWDLFKYGITCTLNQVDSDNGTHQAKQYGISSYIEGAHIAAAIRPSFDSFRKKFLNRIPNDTGSNDLNKLLKLSNSYVLYQENLMQYFEWLGVTPAESIGLIKKISKKKIKPEDFKNLEDRIKKVWMQKVGKEDEFYHSWEMMQSCMAYGFAAPHAVATSLDMCYGAYLKVNYPLEYYTVALTQYSDDQVRTNKLTEELNYFGIKLNPIKFGKSGADYTMDKETRSIYKGIASLKYCNSKIAEELLELSKNKYNDFVDLSIDIKNTTLDSRQLSILVKLDFFSQFGNPNKLFKIIQIFSAVYEKKTAKKEGDIVVVGSKENKYRIPLATFRELFSFDGVYNETQKQIKGWNDIKLIKYLADQVVENTSPIEYVKYEYECLGYVTKNDPSASHNLYLVVKADIRKKIINTDIYEIYSGKTRIIKQWTSQYERNPYEEGDIIRINKIEKKYKRIPSGEVNEKTGKQIWVDDKSSPMEYWLSVYAVEREG